MTLGLLRPTLEERGAQSAAQAQLVALRQRSAFQPLPQPTRWPLRLSVTDVIGPQAAAEIEQSGRDQVSCRRRHRRCQGPSSAAVGG
jgi:hypothetical protein